MKDTREIADADYAKQYTDWPVGYWVLYAEAPQQTMFSVYHKPTDEQITNTERLLGWTWKDAK